MIERLACGYTFADGSFCANDAAGCGHSRDDETPDQTFACGCRMTDGRDAITCDQHSGEDE